MIYVLDIRIPGESEPQTIEVAAPNFLTVVQAISSQYPGVHLLKFWGSYVEGSHGTA